ncbi:MAG TPA: hypothetical protein V6C57_18155 [Coleofasciculaceae cyanobacterium]
MIQRLVQSAFQTGCLSVASEALIRQVLAMQGCQYSDLAALQQLEQAIESGQIQRESSSKTPFASFKTSCHPSTSEKLASVE